jgi:hypothetical protein
MGYIGAIDHRGVYLMPTVLQSGGHRFFFFSREGNEPPHIHVETAEKAAKFWLNTVELVYSYRYNSRELRQIREIVLNNQQLFLEHWNAYFQITS